VSPQDVRELVGGTWLTLTVSLWAVLVWYTGERLTIDGWKKFRADASNQAAIGLLFYMMGEALARAWSLTFIIRGQPPSGDAGWALLGAGGFLGAWGGICLARIFAPRWSQWVAAGIVGLILAAIIVLRT
jgi:hypothetical protein